jgi:hypothetical protein
VASVEYFERIQRPCVGTGQPSLAVHYGAKRIAARKGPPSQASADTGPPSLASADTKKAGTGPPSLALAETGPPSLASSSASSVQPPFAEVYMCMYCGNLSRQKIYL